MPDTLLGGIAINEVLADPNGANNFDTDGNGNASGRDEFVELINLSATPIDIGGFQLWDRGQDNWFTFPSGTTLQPGAVAVVVRRVQTGGSLPTVSGDDLAFDAGFGSNVFNNGGDNVVVYAPTSGQYIQATYNNDALDDPVNGPGYDGFPSGATRSGASEDFGRDRDGFSIQRTSGGFVNDETPTPGMSNVCFASGTLLETPQGFRPVERLGAGDLVNTADAGFQPVRWTFARRVRPLDLLSDPDLRPVTIAHAPRAPLRVSRHHRLLITGKIAQRMFGADQVLAPAKDLLGAPDVFIDPSVRGVFYFHILLDDHHILNANGLAAESLLLGTQAIHAMTPTARAELAILFPDHGMTAVTTRPARQIVAGARARRLVQRHRMNRKPMLVQFDANRSWPRRSNHNPA